MNASYRLGNVIVLSTVLVSAALCLLRVSPRSAEAASGQELGELNRSLPPFSLAERSEKTITNADLADDVWVASFIFTRCPLSCPRISSVMKSLQGKFAGKGVKLVSFSVDPDHDTPKILAEYARGFDADPDRWLFLTGAKDQIYSLIAKGFMLPVEPSDDATKAAGGEAFLHSDRLALVDHGKLLGVYSTNDPQALETLIARAETAAKSSSAPAWAKRLPAVNATLNASCAVLLALGWLFIRSGRARLHQYAMISAVAVSALFLTCYLVYHYQVGSVAFKGTGPIRIVYFTILLSHTVLATLGVVPLVALTLQRAYRKQFDRHALIARVTFPIWMYVSITGVVIYLMLYQMPVGPVYAGIGS